MFFFSKSESFVLQNSPLLIMPLGNKIVDISFFVVSHYFAFNKKSTEII